jgi:hypothetical protein
VVDLNDFTDFLDLWDSEDWEKFADVAAGFLGDEMDERRENRAADKTAKIADSADYVELLAAAENGAGESENLSGVDGLSGFWFARQDGDDELSAGSVPRSGDGEWSAAGRGLSEDSGTATVLERFGGFGREQSADETETDYDDLAVTVGECDEGSLAVGRNGRGRKAGGELGGVAGVFVSDEDVAVGGLAADDFGGFWSEDGFAGINAAGESLHLADGVGDNALGGGIVDGISDGIADVFSDGIASGVSDRISGGIANGAARARNAVGLRDLADDVEAGAHAELEQGAFWRRFAADSGWTVGDNENAVRQLVAEASGNVDFASDDSGINMQQVGRQNVDSAEKSADMPDLDALADLVIERIEEGLQIALNSRSFVG